MTIRALMLTAAFALFAAPALAQQSAPEGQRQDETPTLTSDDVAPAPIQGQPAGAQTQPPDEGDDSALTPEERADAASGRDTGKGDATAAPAKKGPSKEELAWRTRYAQAESQLRAARQRAQNAELQLTEMQNNLGSTNSTQDRNSLAAAIETQGNTVREAQRAASDAQTAFDAVQAEGRSKKFRLAPGPSPTTESGRPNLDYYQQKVSKATGDYADADRRVQIYQDRVNDARGRILNNSGSGDQFAGARLQEELDASLKELDKAQSDRNAARQRLDQARQEAAAAGVSVR